MKAIAWEDTIHILAEGDQIIIKENGVTLVPRESTHVFLNIFKDKDIAARLETDEHFKKMIKPILGNILSQLIVSKELQILDLRGSLINAKIELKEEPPVETDKQLDLVTA